MEKESRQLTKKLIEKVDITKILIYSLILLILIAPTVLKQFKIILLIGLIIVSIYKMLKDKSVFLNRKILIWVAMYTLFNFVFLIRGTFNNFEVFKQLAPVNIVWPILYTITLIIPFAKVKDFDLAKLVSISTIFIAVYTLYIYLNYEGILPDTFLLLLPLGQVINEQTGYIDFFMPSITSLFFLMPYLISVILTQSNSKRRKIALCILVVSGLVISLIIGRRALIAIIMGSPFLSIFLLIITKKYSLTKFKSAIKLFVILLLTFVFTTALVRMTSYELRIENYDSAPIQEGTEARIDQFSALINGWKTSPIFGVGLGKNAEVIRSNVPGFYELTYIARLFQTGIFGLLFYLALISWLVYQLIVIARNSTNYNKIVIPLISGIISLLFAEITNPYTASFDGLWVFFFGLAVINSSYLRLNSERIIDCE